MKTEADPTAIADDDELLGAVRLAVYTPIRDYPPMADRKATAILAADGLMISVLLIFRQAFEDLVRGPNLAVTYLLLTLIASFAVLFLIGGFCCYHTLTKPIPPMPDSPAFFPHIARSGLDAYKSQVRGLSLRQVVRAFLDYNYSLAVLCTEKFVLVRRATACIRVQFFLWVILIVAIALQKA